MCSLSLSSNISPTTQLTIRFLRALMKIKLKTPTSSCKRSFRKRGRMIRFALGASMASAFGYKRSWSRTMLLKIHNRARLNALTRQKHKKKKKSTNKDLCRTDELRRLVPGGEAMDLCSLLEETGHYIKCLNIQVKVMQGMVDLYSSSA